MARTHHDPGCGYRLDDFRHWKACEPPNRWPVGPFPSHATHTPGYEPGLSPTECPETPQEARSDVLTTEVDSSATTEILGPEIALQRVCECGWAPKPNRTGKFWDYDMKTHKRFSRAHR